MLQLKQFQKEVPQEEILRNKSFKVSFFPLDSWWLRHFCDTAILFVWVYCKVEGWPLISYGWPMTCEWWLRNVNMFFFLLNNVSHKLKGRQTGDTHIYHRHSYKSTHTQTHTHKINSVSYMGTRTCVFINWSTLISLTTPILVCPQKTVFFYLDILT